MSEFHECVVGTFDKELQALIDYGHDCCARIDDRIYECCQRIREAHEREIGAFELALTWKDAAPLPQYDVLDNERHKVVCELREMPDCYPSYSAFPFAKWYEDLSTALGIDKGEVSCAKVRDTLIHLLGGNAMEVEDGVDAGRCGDTSAGGDVHAAAGRVDNCAGDQLAEGVAPITQELRDYLSEADDNLADDWLFINVEWSEVNQLCDLIDTVYKDLERENEELRQRTMYPAESERINMLEREVKRLTAECKTQRNNFDQATSAREHWKSLYEQSLKQIHDLEHDVEMWRDRAEDMRMERDDALKEHHAWAPESHYVMLPKDADGVPIHIGDVMDSKVDYLFDGKPFTVRGLVLCEDGWEVTDGRFGNRYKPDSLHHHREPTVEDVLRGVVTLCHNTWKEGSAFEFYDVDDVMKNGNIADFAAKLHLAEDA